MRVLVAFDKFRDALTADEACAAACETLQALQPSWELDACPLTDGGEGFASILTRSAGGKQVEVTVTGPLGAAVTAPVGLVPVTQLSAFCREQLGLPHAGNNSKTLAIIEMASASGLQLLRKEQRDPWHTSTCGTGELIAIAAHHGAAAILLGVGGSATNDLGLGALAVLGLGAQGTATSLRAAAAPANWADLQGFTGQVPAHLPPIHIACDVTNPLLGPRGCVAAFAPQKGLRLEDIPALQRATERVAGMLALHCGAPPDSRLAPGTGAAGGIAFGLSVAARARLVSGSTLVSDWLRIDQRVSAADFVLTGEGRFDASSLEGKGAGAIVARARALGRPVAIFAGGVTVALHDLAEGHAITPDSLSLAEALPQTRALLAAALTRRFGPPLPPGGKGRV